jgi:hypothetical protein
MTVQEATEAANINSEQMRSSFGAHGTMWGGSSDHGEDYGIGW